MKLNHFIYFFLFLLLSSSCSQIEKSEINYFALSDIELLESPFNHSQQLNYDYVMAHDADRLLAPFLIDAGLTPKAERYGNWESDGLDGHIGGHYLTALSLIVASMNDEAAEARLNYMIDELERCQQANEKGYVGGVPGGFVMWEDIAQGKIRAGGFSLNEKWVPLYNIHKLFAGLRDAWLYANNEKAKDILIKLTDYFYTIIENLSDEQMEDMLRSEYGGLNETFADVYAITNDARHLEMAEKFSQKFILNPLLAREDKLNGMHANTQIPKVIGFERVAEVANNEEWQKASEFFWDIVVSERSVTIGGNSVSEHFHPSSDFTAMLESKEGPETCNTYNMMRLSKMLFAQTGEMKYVDFYERSMYNHILSSQHPEHGGLVYFTSMRPQHYRVYSQPEVAFWCCVGSGIENHSKYGEFIYAYDNSGLFVNLFVSSKLNWNDKNITVTQESEIPYNNSSSLTLNMDESQKFELRIRNPKWVEARETVVKINDKVTKKYSIKDEFIVINQKWNDGDVVEVEFSIKTYAEQLPDNSPYYSIMYGPLVLAAETGRDDLDGLLADGSRMGHVAHGKLYSRETAPIIVINDDNWIDNISKANSDKLEFTLSSLIYPESKSDITLIPFASLHDARYIVYWQVMKQEDLEANLQKLQQEEEKKIEIERKTIDKIATGQQQPETEHNFRSGMSEAGVHQDRHWRHAHDWFAYDLVDKKKEARAVVITYFGGDRNRSFDILLDGSLLQTVELDGSLGGDFIDVEYEIPANLKSKLGTSFEIKFEAKENSMAGGIYGIRLMR